MTIKISEIKSDIFLTNVTSLIKLKHIAIRNGISITLVSSSAILKHFHSLDCTMKIYYWSEVAWHHCRGDKQRWFSILKISRNTSEDAFRIISYQPRRGVISSMKIWSSPREAANLFRERIGEMFSKRHDEIKAWVSICSRDDIYHARIEK